MFSRGMLLFWILCWSMEVMHCQPPIVDQTTPADSWRSRIGLTGNPHKDKPLLEKERDRLELDINGTKQKRDNAKEKATGLEEEKSNLTTSISELERELQQLENDKANAGKVKKEYDDQVASTKTVIAQINVTIEGLAANLTDTEKKIEEATINRNSAEDNLKNLQKELDNELKVSSDVYNDIFNVSKIIAALGKDDKSGREKWKSHRKDLINQYNESFLRTSNLFKQKSEKESEFTRDNKVTNLNEMKRSVEQRLTALRQNRSSLLQKLQIDGFTHSADQSMLSAAQSTEDASREELLNEQNKLAEVNNITLPEAKEEAKGIQKELSNKEKELREVKEAIVKAEVDSVYWVEPTTVIQKSDDGTDWEPIIKIVLSITGGLVVAAVVIGGVIWLILCIRNKKRIKQEAKERALKEQLEKVKLEKEQLEKEKLEKERLEKLRLEEEQKKKEWAERKAEEANYDETDSDSTGSEGFTEVRCTVSGFQ